MKGRQKRALGAVFGLDNFGVNLTQLAPGAVSALRHAHTRQDEFVYVLQGRPVLRTDAGDTPMAPGMGASFKAGTGDAHQLLNPTDETVVYLEVGDRSAGDAASVEARTLGATVSRARNDDVVTGCGGRSRSLHRCCGVVDMAQFGPASSIAFRTTGVEAPRESWD